MGSPLRQTSFAGGEYASTWWGRNDLDGYARGLRLCRNFIPTPSGPAENRPGTRFCAETYASGAAVVRRFEFSDDDALVLVFSHLRVRFIRDGAVVENTPGTPYELVTPYAAADLPFLRFAQVGDVVTIACKGHDPRELARTVASPLTFTLTVIDFDIPAPWFSGSVPYVDYASLPTADSTHPAKAWRWRFTAVLRSRSTGILRESAPYEVTKSIEYTGPGTPPPRTFRDLPDEIACYADRPVKFVLDGPYGIVVDPGVDLVTIRVYRGLGAGSTQLFGYVGETGNYGSGGYDFIDYGDEPDFAMQPPQGRDPFYFPASAWTSERTEHPAVVAFHEQRRIFARTDERRAWIFASRTGSYRNYDRYLPSTAADPFEPEIAADRFEEIRALVPGEPLVALGSGSEWTLEGSGTDTAMGPTSFRARPRTEHGASWTAPVRVGTTVVYVQKKGNVLRGLSLSPQGVEDDDLSILARHLFEDEASQAFRTVTELAYAEDPWGIIWAVLDDGTLLSFTMDRKFNAHAWAKHDVGGAVESICTIPEGDEDVLYMVVRRTINGSTKRYVERMATRRVRVAAEGIFLDSAITDRDVPVTVDGDRVIVVGLDHLEGEAVVALADGKVIRVGLDAAPLVVASGSVTLPDASGAGFDVIHVGLGYVSDLQTLDAPAEKGRQKTVSRAWVEVDGSRGGSVGTDFDNLQAWPSRSVSDGYGTPGLATKVYEVPLKGTWAKSGSVAVRQSDPLPLTVVSITREVEYGG